MRRLLLLYLCSILLAVAVPQSREMLRLNWHRPEVQAFVDGYIGRSAAATVALWRYAQMAATRARPGPANAVPKAEDWRLVGAGCTLTTEQAEAILKEYKSPAVGYGYAFTAGCNRTGVDNGYVMAQFIQESGAGTTGVAAHTNSSGNIKCTDDNCYQGFQVYPGWTEGIEAHFDLLKLYSVRSPSGRQHQTIASAIAEWAPAEDNNDPASYANAVKQAVTSWRNINRAAVTSMPASVLAPAGSVVSADITPSQGCVWTNAVAAYKNNPKLRDVTIPPGGSWSHNEAWETPAGQVVCGNILAGGQCDVASRYYSVARQLGLHPVAPPHGVALGGLSYSDSIVINTEAFGTANGQDLVIENGTNKTLRLVAELDDRGWRVKGWLE